MIELENKTKIKESRKQNEYILLDAIRQNA